MSLLMDALRKAEESKKQAERENNTATDSGKTEIPDDASPGSEPDEDKNRGQNSPPNLDIPVEFDEPDVESKSVSLDAGTSFELEPRTETQVRAPSYTEEQLETIQATTASSHDSLNKKVPGDERDHGVANPSEPFHGSAHEQVSSSEEEIQGAGGSPATTGQELTAARSGGDKQKKNEIQTSFETPQPEAEPETSSGKESITERTATSRKSAKSVFEAKKKPAQKNRLIVISSAGIAVVLILGAGFYLYSSSLSNSGISVPANNYSTNQSSVSEDSIVEAEPLERFEEEPSFTSLGGDQDTVTSLFDQAILAETVTNDFNSVISGEQVTRVSTAEIILPEQEQIDVATGSLVSSPSIEPGTATDTTVGSSGDVLIAPGLSTEAAAVSSAVALTPTATDSRNTGAVLDEASSLSSVEAPAPRELVSFRRTEPAGISPELNQAYEVYQRGDFARARNLYTQTLVEAPDNIDALEGLAAIAASENRTSRAMELYSRILYLDPSNVAAKAALRSLAPTGSVTEQERELRRLDAQNPEVPALAFALGNFYAGQARWTDAQQYYFKALQLAKSNRAEGAAVSPDYAFNLAVSLERLNQQRPARDYYEEALVLSRQLPANFDLDVVRARLNKLDEASDL